LHSTLRRLQLWAEAYRAKFAISVDYVLCMTLVVYIDELVIHDEARAEIPP
jgi:hypothetical protein